MRFVNLIPATVALLLASPVIAGDEAMLRDVQQTVHSKVDFHAEQDGKDNWKLPTNGLGDCEDFALLKRAMLIEKGWQEDDLKLVLAYNQALGGHAVLWVKSLNIILDSPNDNKKEQILPKAYSDWKREGGFKVVCIFADISFGDKKAPVTNRCEKKG